LIKKWAGKAGGGHLVPKQRIGAAIGALAILFAVPAMAEVTGDAPRGEAAITCTNPSSGVSWQIKIDYDHSTVDSNPARIGASEISWHDASNGWYYALDRKSGDLTVTLASATGGNFLYDHCKLEN
jgi:hypothetical protein